MASEHKTSENFDFEPALAGDKDRIFSFLLKSFYPDEPVSSSLHEQPQGQHECRSLGKLEEGHSFLLVDTFNKSRDNIVGAALNYEVTPSDVKELENLQSNNNSRRYELLLHFFVKFERDADVWKKLKIRRALKLVILAVSPDYRGLGVAQKLVTKTVEHARSQNFSHVLVVTTSFYSARAMDKFGFQCVYQTRIDEYVDEKREVVFKTVKPHEFMKFFVLGLSE